MLQIAPVRGLPEVRPGDDLAALLLASAELQTGDILVVTQKIVSKAEGRLVDLRTVEPSPVATRFARTWDRDPRQVEVVLRESVRIVRMVGGLIISETSHGFICANAGVDVSNAGQPDVAILMPVDSDASARRLRDAIREARGVQVAVIISDTFGRPWRFGITNVAIGIAGMQPLVDYRGQHDPIGYELKATIVAVADELAAAAELVMGKTDACPAAVIRGYKYEPAESSIRELLMDPDRDLFR